MLPVLALVVWLLRSGVTLDELGLADPRHRYRDGPVIAFALLALFLFWIVTPLTVLAEAFLGHEEALAPPLPAGAAGMLMIAYYALSAALVEETLFRGVPAALLLRHDTRRSHLAYIATSGIGFGAWHESYGLSVVIACVLVGFAVAALYIAIRNLWPLIGAHFAYDVWAFWPLLPTP